MSQVTILNWIRKYSKLVNEFVSELSPGASGKWHEDETMIRVEGRDTWFREMLDDTKFLVAPTSQGREHLKIQSPYSERDTRWQRIDLKPSSSMARMSINQHLTESSTHGTASRNPSKRN